MKKIIKKYNRKKTAANKAVKKTVKRPATDKPDKGEKFPHFRRYKKSDHPALIVGEQLSERKKEEYNYRKVMHGERDGERLNEKVYPNPNFKDKEPMYIGKRVRHDEKKHFGERLPWKYPKKDNKKK
jgi:hypothetical protein